MGYFSRYPKAFTQGQMHDDCSDVKLQNLKELSLSLTTTKGQALFVGCSHSGVELIAQQTKKETGKTIELLMGGFHLLPFNRQETQKIVNMLKNDLGIQKVAPGHCSGHLAFKLLKDAYQKDFLFAGLGEVIQF
jgi:7,8-dihydropterin-6-yl-methyl-4-(beta-D-ribofuranosyl)aminobenzene 5'-phosphate synthase